MFLELAAYENLLRYEFLFLGFCLLHNTMQLVRTVFYYITLLPPALATTCNSANALPCSGSLSSGRSDSSSGGFSSPPSSKSADAAVGTYTTCVNGCITMPMTDLLSCSTTCLDTLCTSLCNLQKETSPKLSFDMCRRYLRSPERQQWSRAER